VTTARQNLLFAGSPSIHGRSLSGEDWIGASITLVQAYLTENPTVNADDVLACTRVALIQLLTSLYGVKDHYLQPGASARGSRTSSGSYAFVRLNAC